MDNNFYERGEYRRRSASAKAKDSEKRKNTLSKITLLHLALALVVTGILFLACRGDGGFSKGIKEFYASTVGGRDMAASELLEVFKKAAQFTFAPTTSWDPEVTAQKNEEKTSENSGSEEESASALGETEEQTGEKAVFSPVCLTVSPVRPVNGGTVTSGFGYRVSPITGEYSLHKGVDIAAEEGSRVLAAYGGTVTEAGYNSVSGNYLIIKHSESLFTTYNHCKILLAAKGEKVKAGSIVALVGDTGYATGPHLHFEINLNGSYINPGWVL